MNKRLEQYVETVNIGLKRLPPNEREKEIAELKQHLEALAQARSERGDSEENAIDGAIQQFGHAVTIQRRLVAAYWRRRLTAFRLSWFGAAACTVFAVYSVYTFVPIVRNLVYNPYNPSNDPVVLFWSGYAMLLLQCCLIGWLSFRLGGRRSLSILAAIVIWFNLYCTAPQIMRAEDYSEDWWQLIILAASSLALPFLAAYTSLRQYPLSRKV